MAVSTRRLQKELTEITTAGTPCGRRRRDLLAYNSMILIYGDRYYPAESGWLPNLVSNIGGPWGISIPGMSYNSSFNWLNWLITACYDDAIWYRVKSSLSCSGLIHTIPYRLLLSNSSMMTNLSHQYTQYVTSLFRRFLTLIISYSMFTLTAM